MATKVILKKEEVLSILSTGGHIQTNERRRAAGVYRGTERIGTCRYDTAKNILAMPGYTSRRLAGHGLEIWAAAYMKTE